MDGIEQALREHYCAIERYVRFRIANPADAEDVLQEVLSRRGSKLDRVAKRVQRQALACWYRAQQVR